MPNSFHQLGGCSVRHTYLHHTSKSCFPQLHFLPAFTPTCLQSRSSHTTHFKRSWLWDNHACYKKDATQPSTMTKNMGFCSGKTLDWCTVLPKYDFQSHWWWWKWLCKSQLSSVNWTRFDPSHCQNNINKSKSFHSHSHGYSYLSAANPLSTWPNIKLLQLVAVQPWGFQLIPVWDKGVRGKQNLQVTLAGAQEQQPHMVGWGSIFPTLKAAPRGNAVLT